MDNPSPEDLQKILHTKTITIFNENFKLKIWNVVKSLENTPLQDLSVDGIILVYDLSNKLSFDNIKLWLEKIKKDTSISDIMLVGIDGINSQYRQVSLCEAHQFAWNQKISYLETNRDENNNLVNDIFNIFVERMLATRMEKIPQVKEDSCLMM